jgi:hypothetical protein
MASLPGEHVKTTLLVAQCLVCTPSYWSIDIFSWILFYFQSTRPAFTLYYNDSALHGLPLQLNIWANAWYRAYSNDTSWKIDVTSRSLPKVNPTVQFSNRIFNAIRLIGLAFCMISGQFGYVVCEDRKVNMPFTVTRYRLPHPRVQKYIQMVHRNNAQEAPWGDWFWLIDWLFISTLIDIDWLIIYFHLNRWVQSNNKRVRTY